jgi:predicted nucleic acid-binding protein
VRFWDSSAVVPLLTHEPGTGAARRLLRDDPNLVVWMLTRVEVMSALCRKRREGRLDAQELETSKRNLEKLAAHWVEIKALLPVRGYAERFLVEHPLRAADALQLGAAWHHADGHPKRRELVVFDGPLIDVAAKVGFRVVGRR